VVDDKRGNQVRERTIDITGQENQQLSEVFDDLGNSGKPYTATVTVTDSQGASASDSGQTG
jgi:hypothetical protein